MADPTLERLRDLPAPKPHGPTSRSNTEIANELARIETAIKSLKAQLADHKLPTMAPTPAHATAADCDASVTATT